jgi:hypothetical protein
VLGVPLHRATQSVISQCPAVQIFSTRQ